MNRPDIHRLRTVASGSMSSIKREVKKKLRPRPEARWFLEIQPTLFRYPEGVRLVVHSRKLSRLLVAKLECARRGKQDECQPWFYPRLVAYRYFWLSEGA
jgi:hypothetical protein